MSSRILNIYALLFLLLLFPGCGRMESPSRMALPPSGAGKAPMTSYADKSTTASSESGEREESSGERPVARQNAGPRMIIYTARIYISVKELDTSAKSLSGMVKESRGYYTASSIDRNSSGGKTGSFTIKIPAETLTPFIDKISQLGEVTSQNQSGQDVTEEFVDQSARLRNMEIEEKKYQEMYSQAKSVDDMLKVRRELGRVRGDIEALEGRLNYLKNNVAMATVELSLIEQGKGTPRSFWNLTGTVGDAFTALKHLTKVVIVMIIYFTIVILPFIIVIILIVKAMRRAPRMPRSPGPSKGNGPGKESDRGAEE